MDSERGKRTTIFLIEEDDETRRILAQNLRRDGYHVIISIDEEDALERVGGGHFHADLLLVDLIGKFANEVLNVGRRVREHVKYDGQIPLVVMPEKYSKDVEGTEAKVSDNDWVFYLGEDPDQLQNFLNSLLPNHRAS